MPFPAAAISAIVAAVNAINYPGLDGFLGTRASLMLDLLVLAMAAVVLVLGWSIYEVKYRRRYTLHKWIQVTLGVVLLLAVIAFEVDVRLHGWQDRAAGELGGHASQLVMTSLAVHLVFAVAATILWPVVIIRALLNFPSPPVPGPHSRFHVRWARIAAIDMFITAITGWTFYYLAFVR
jgi:putative membrane protein